MSSSTGCQLNQVQSILVYSIIKVLIDIPNQEKTLRHTLPQLFATCLFDVKYKTYFTEGCS